MVKNSWITNLADHLVGPHRAAGPGPHPDGFRVSPRMEPPPPPWATCARAQSPSE